MEKRIALIPCNGIIFSAHLHNGVPYRERGVSVISVIIDADHDSISTLSGKLGMIQGVSTKTVYATK